MSLPAIDWRELSVQVMVTFAHFLWQGCVVGIILCIVQYVGESLRDSQLRRGRLSAVRNVSLGETDLHGASIRYAIACIAFFSLPIGVIATFAWVHQSRGPFVLVSGDPAGSQELSADNALARVSDTVIPARSLPATLMKGEITASETSNSANPAVPPRMSPSQFIQAFSPQITRETIRISALGYETKVFRLPDELDRSQPIRRDIRLKPMPDVELRVLLPDETPAENAKLTFHYPNELDCLQDDERLSDARGIVTTEFPPNADIGIFRLEHTGGTAELPMKELLDDVHQSPGNIIHRSIMLRKPEKPTGWISARPQKITVSSGSAIIIDDNSVRLAGTATSQEVTAHFTFEEPETIDELRLELLPVYVPSGRKIGRGGDELILFDVKAGVQQPAGEWTTHEFSGCISLLNPDDATTVNCIDYLSDTGWTVPVLPADREAHTLVLRFDEPVTLQPGEQLVLTVDSGGSLKFAALNRIRFAFR